MQQGWLVLSLLVVAAVAAGATTEESAYEPKWPNFKVCDIIASQGYPCETHTAPTDDGWRLSINRIPRGLTNVTGSGVVFFQHGFTDSAAGICMNDKTESLPYILADLGYDVWLGNNRGNGQSMTHIKYKPNQKEFWDFTFDEMGQYDLPAQLDYVLNATKQQTVSYIGHSQGTIQAFIGFLDPKVAAKVNIFIAMAPVAYIHHTGSKTLRNLADWGGDVILQVLGLNEFALPEVIQMLLPGICEKNVTVCAESIAELMGPTTHFNASRTPYYTRYFPAPASVKDLAHWAQQVRKDVFEKYDYGSPAENNKHYGQPTPPQYDVTKLPTTLKIALFSGGNDYLGDPTDVAHLLHLLPPKCVILNDIQKDFAHADFILGYDANTRIYPQLIQLLNQHAIPIV